MRGGGPSSQRGEFHTMNITPLLCGWCIRLYMYSHYDDNSEKKKSDFMKSSSLRVYVAKKKCHWQQLSFRNVPARRYTLGSKLKSHSVIHNWIAHCAIFTYISSNNLDPTNITNPKQSLSGCGSPPFLSLLAKWTTHPYAIYIVDGLSADYIFGVYHYK